MLEVNIDGVVPGGSPLRGWFQVVPIPCRRCLDHRIAVCGTLKCLVLSAVHKLLCSTPTVLFSVDDGEALASHSVEMKCFCLHVQLICDYRRSDAWFD